MLLVDSYLHLGQNHRVEVKVVELQDEGVRELTRLDQWGLFLSGLCAIHCMAVPVLVLTLPFLAEKFESPWVHIIMALFVVPIGLFAFWSGFRHHGKSSVLWIGWSGLLLVGSAALMPALWRGFLGDDGITILGSLLLISAHLLNRRACAGHHH